MMTWDEFYDIVESKFSIASINGRGHTATPARSATACVRKREWLDENWNRIGTDKYYELRWETGGRDGGNCWGDSAKSYTCDDQEPEPAAIDELLELVCPAITYLEYRKVFVGLWELYSYQDYEYYGNYTDYKVKRIYYRKLYSRLVEFGVI